MPNEHKICECVLGGITLERVVRNEELVMPDMHFHKEYEIYYMFNGERYYFIENKTYRVRKSGEISESETAQNVIDESVLFEQFAPQYRDSHRAAEQGRNIVNGAVEWNKT